jgi:lysozyme
MARKTRKNGLKKFSAITVVILAGALYLGYPYLEFARLWFGVVGVDVSHHQNDSDWQKLSKTDVRFAYIKATEGGDYVDPLFKQNWDAARKAGLAVGAYHFFTRCKTGAEQAKNFLAVFPREADALPPVLDAEKMEPCGGTAPELDPLKEVGAFLDAVKNELGCRPVIYVTPQFDFAYLEGSFESELFWARSLFVPPLFRRSGWVFWQYHNDGRRNGVNGPVDLNVFRGGPQDFESFRKASTCFKKVS